MQPGPKTVLLLVSFLLLMGSVAAANEPHHPLSQIYPIDTNLSMDGFNVTEVPWIVPEGGDLKIDGDLNLATSDIIQYYDSACPDDYALRNIHPNGSFTCVSLVDSVNDQFVDESGDSMAGILNMSDNRIVRIPAPQAPGDAVNRSYVDDVGDDATQTLQEVLQEGNSAGGLGMMDLNSISVTNPLTDDNISDSITVQASGISGTISDGQVTNGLTVSSSGSVDTGALSGTIGNPIDTSFFTTSTPLEAGNISALNWTQLQEYPGPCGANEAIQTLGDTITCINVNRTDANISGDGTANEVAFFKNDTTLTSEPLFYWNDSEKNLGLDESVPQYTLDVGGVANLQGNLRLNTNNINGVGTIDATTIQQGGTDIQSIYVDASGDTLAGNLSFDDTYYITNLSDPLAPQDAATKSYVDILTDSTNQTLAEVLEKGNDAQGIGITNLNSISVTNPLTDDNISNTITIDSGGTVDTGALQGTVTNDVNAFVSVKKNLSDGNISDDITIRSTGSVAPGALTRALVDSEVSDSISISSSGSIDAGAIDSGTLSISYGGTGAGSASNARSNLNAAGTGTCPSGFAVQNTTSGGVECVELDENATNELQTIEEVLQEGQDAGGLGITNLNSISVTNALTDGNISNTITIDSTGTVNTGALSGTVTNNIDTGFLTTGTPLTSGNISSGAITATELASNAVTASGGELDSSVGGVNINITPQGKIAVDQGSGSGLNADLLDGNQPSGLVWSNLGVNQWDINVSDLGTADSSLNFGNSYRARGLLNPKYPQDAATKDYVDTQAGAANQTLEEVLQEGNNAGGLGMVNLNSISLTNPLTDGNVSNSITIGSSGSVDPQAIDSTIADTGLGYSSGQLSVNTADGITTSGDNVILASGAAGTGINYNTGTLSVDYGSTSGTAAQGNVTINVGAGTGLTGGGDLTVGDDSSSITLNTNSNVPLKDQRETITADGWTFQNNLTVQGNLDVFGNITSTDVSNLNVNGSIVPPSQYDNTFDLGNGSRRWRNAYIAQNLYDGNSDNFFEDTNTGNGLRISGIDSDGTIQTATINHDNLDSIDPDDHHPQIDAQDSGTSIVDGPNAMDFRNALAVSTDGSGVDIAVGSNTIGDNEVADNSLTVSSLATGAVNSDELAVNAVNSTHIDSTDSYTISGLDMQDNRIQNVRSTNAGDAVNKSYVDSNFGTANQTLEEVLQEGNSAGNQDIDMSSQNINNLQSIDNGGSAVRIDDNVDMNGNALTDNSGSEMCIGDQCS